jgi:hypothetical protein
MNDGVANTCFGFRASGKRGGKILLHPGGKILNTAGTLRTDHVGNTQFDIFFYSFGNVKAMSVAGLGRGTTKMVYD